jgi:formiminotetrahydrofolate cyclodeaminase
VAALAARAGAEGAALNVLVNLGAIKDSAFKDRCVADTGSLVADARRRCDAVQARVKSTFSVTAEF